MAQHLGGQRVTKLVGSLRRRVDAGAFNRMLNDRPNGFRGHETTDRGSASKKYAATGAARPSALEVLDDRLAHVRGQGQFGPLATLTAYQQASRSPINVIELEKGHLTGAQPEPCEQEQDGVVPTPSSGASVDTGQQPAYLIRRNRSGNRRHRPVGHRWNAGGQIKGNVAAIERVSSGRTAAQWSTASLASGAGPAPGAVRNFTTSRADNRDSTTRPLPNRLWRKQRTNGR